MAAKPCRPLLSARLLDCPPNHAELLLHVRPDRLRELRQVQQGLDGVMSKYAEVRVGLLGK